MGQRAGGLVTSVVALTAACSQHPITTFPSTLRRHAQAFAERGRAAIFLVPEQRTVTVDADTEVEVDLRDGPGYLTRVVTVGELVAGCPPPAPAAPAQPVELDAAWERAAADAPPVLPTPACLADRAVEREIIIGQRQERHLGRAISTAVTGAFVLGVAGICLAECDGKVVLTGAALVVGLGLLIASIGMG
ncbi:MAG: hypothetical protein R3B06_15300 [Kofleriaceae bacterium]